MGSNTVSGWTTARIRKKRREAAAHHLRDLYGMFGDWYLAMAAYDSGPGAVQRAVERTGYADFWELYKRNALPKETRNYVPIILALTLIAKDPARYGIDVEPEEPLRTDTVHLDHPVDLRLVADTIDVDLDTLRALNPQLLRLVTPATPSFSLHLPEGTADEFTAAMAEIPADKWTSWRRHQVLEGETLAGVAAKYHVSATAIADTNNLDSARAAGGWRQTDYSRFRAGTSGPAKLVHYRVRAGDTLESVADEFDVSVAEVKKWNHLRTGKVVRGTRLTDLSRGSGSAGGWRGGRRGARPGEGSGEGRPARNQRSGRVGPTEGYRPSRDARRDAMVDRQGL